MYAAFGVLAGITVSVLALRQWLLRREGTPSPSEPFDGHVYRVGKAVIAERRCEQPRATVIGMHGFVADMRYFTRHYGDADIQLILVTSCDYHLPITTPREHPAPWAKIPKEPEGTIAHDAAVLVQALEHLPKTDQVRVHGHSRGGAVVLEAAKQRPDLFERVEVVLEAPVLPQARPYTSLSRAQLWLLPFLIPLWRRAPIARHNRGAWGPLEDVRKRELIMAFPFNPKRVSTMVANLLDIGAWSQERDASVFRNVRRGTVLVPGKDRVLESSSMLESAQRGMPELNVVKLDGCSHFVVWDRPDAMPALARVTERSTASG
ncbi:alpha/beta fold hydrolase [Myxococcus qinghaiensis]|uniref:alpha/beta fold hydrolase n=1 Tax=Myxococcus qinghaiensis TaxID=2906758 RepID=UPI0020A6E55F|nr:alpha/beta hydrolase [Myxococcus qinghaiensis]MCP3163351.1 alpha/beta hydrolase [Myxococcus qinghaiensis]